MNLSFNAGSAQDPKNHEGLAHLLEHMMFGENKFLKHGEMSQLIEAAGGSANAWTSRFGTCYQVEIDPENASFALLMLSQIFNREGFKDKALKLEKRIVVAEIAERIHQPDTSFFEQLVKLAAAQFTRPISGTRSSVARISSEDLMNFWHQYYVPSNATLAISGNYDEVKASNAIHKHFATVARPDRNRNSGRPIHAIVEPQSASAGVRSPRRSSQSFDNYSRLGLTYDVERLNERELLALNIACDFLEMNQSPFMNEFRDEDIVQKPCFIIMDSNANGVVSVDIKMLSPCTPNLMHARFLEVISRAKVFIKDPKHQDLLKVVKQVMSLAAVHDYQSISLRADAITKATIFNRSRTISLNSRLKMIASIEPEELSQVLVKVFHPSGHSAFYQHPRVARSSNADDLRRKALLSSELGAASVLDKLARMGISVNPSSDFNLAVNEIVGLQVNHRAYLRQVDDKELIALRANIIPRDNLSLKDFVALKVLSVILNRGSAAMTEQEMNCALARHGASSNFSYYADDRLLKFDLDLVTQTGVERPKQIKPTIRLLKSIFVNPRFTEKDFTESVISVRDLLLEGQNDPRQRGVELLNHALYREGDSRREYLLSEQLKALKQLSVDELKDFYRRFTNNSKVELVSVGKLKANDLRNLACGFSPWQANGELSKSVTYPVQENQGIATRVKFAGAKVDTIIIGNSIYGINNTNRELLILNMALIYLVGNTNSYLGSKLRESSGLTYSMSYSTRKSSNGIDYDIAVPVEPKFSKFAQELIRTLLIRAAKQGVSVEELSLVKTVLRTEFLTCEHDTSLASADSILADMRLGLKPDDMKNMLPVINSITVEEINIMLARMAFDKAALVVAGRKS